MLKERVVPAEHRAGILPGSRPVCSTYSYTDVPASLEWISKWV